MASPSNQNGDSVPTTVFKTNDLPELAVAKSILEAAELYYFVKGEQIQSLFGLGSIGSVNPVTGPAELQVAARDRDAALDALSVITG